MKVEHGRGQWHPWRWIRKDKQRGAAGYLKATHQESIDIVQLQPRQARVTSLTQLQICVEQTGDETWLARDEDDMVGSSPRDLDGDRSDTNSGSSWPQHEQVAGFSGI